MEGWGDLQWTDEDVLNEAVFRYWAERSSEAPLVMLELECIRLDELTGKYD